MTSTTKNHTPYVTTAQITLWTIATFCYSYDTQKLYNTYDDPALIVDLLLAQVLISLFIAACVNITRNEFYDIDISIIQDFQPTTLTFPLPIALLHLVATALTNLSFRVVGASSTLIWKLSEPLFALILYLVILGESVSTMSAIGVVLGVAGTTVFSIESFTLMKLSAKLVFPILLGSMFYLGRNAIIKLEQSASQLQFPEQTFFAINRGCLPFAVVLFVIRLWFSRPAVESVSFLMRTGMLFSTQQLLSLFILHQLDLMTHSMANTMKRLGILGISSMFVGQAVSHTHVCGLLTTAVGLTLYLFGERLSKGQRMEKTAVRCGLIGVLLFVLTLALLLEDGPSETSSSDVKMTIMT